MADHQHSRWLLSLGFAFATFAAAPLLTGAPPAPPGTDTTLGPLATPPSGQPASAPKSAAGAPAKPGAPPAKEPEERKPEQLTLKHSGRPEGKELDVSTRYYLWSDPDGWHLRSCCKDKYYATFKGVVTVTGGKFAKFRPIELEAKGKHPDAWVVNEDRTRLEYVINSSDHPDGFDFTVAGKDAVLTFDLKVGDKERPKQIYIGHDNLHPKTSFFEVPADHK